MKSPKLNLLIAEQNPFLAGILQQTLSSEFNVKIATNGIEAVEFIEQGKKPDLVITELNLHHFDGIDLIRLLRGSQRYKNIPILALSGTLNSTLRIQSLEMGADDCVAKPFNPLEIKARVMALIRRTAFNGHRMIA
ncbi:response regulator transcription factor [Larkinella terrae]|uniref:Response regulator n=1 Tax=Larkinella terrae TaxID=2025311 RepID=A0A7K0EK95_9BACT|nr:response regulator transcription factor [Larkinella terrae]MRS62214.1 response regulator [Larkinella terrae]